MARLAIARDTRMIEYLGSKGIVGVAYVTILQRRYMACCLNGVWIRNKLADVTAFTATGESRVDIGQEFQR